jgi:hypothetical protein
MAQAENNSNEIFHIHTVINFAPPIYIKHYRLYAYHLTYEQALDIKINTEFASNYITHLKFYQIRIPSDDLIMAFAKLFYAMVARIGAMLLSTRLQLLNLQTANILTIAQLYNENRYPHERPISLY